MLDSELVPIKTKSQRLSDQIQEQPTLAESAINSRLTDYHYTVSRNFNLQNLTTQEREITKQFATLFTDIFPTLRNSEDRTYFLHKLLEAMDAAKRAL